MRSPFPSRPGPLAPAPPEVRLHIGRLVLDAAVAGSRLPDTERFAAWLEAAIGERLGDRAQGTAQADRRPVAVNAVADTIVAHVRPAVGRVGGA